MLHMDSWIERIWNDSVWSKVIAAAVLAGGGFLTSLWRSQKLRTKLTATWTPFKIYLVRLWKWLTVPISIPRVLVGLVGLVAGGELLRLGLVFLPVAVPRVAIIVSLVTATVLIAKHMDKRMRADLKMVTEAAAKTLKGALSEAVAAARAEERAIADAKLQGLHEIEIARERAELELATYKQQLAPQPTPVDMEDGKTKQLLIHLCSRYSEGSTARSIEGQIFLGSAATEQLLDNLAAMGLVEFRIGGYGSTSVWALTKKGRDYCLERNLDLLG
jgi:hypothetical protein